MVAVRVRESLRACPWLDWPIRVPVRDRAWALLGFESPSDQISMMVSWAFGGLASVVVNGFLVAIIFVGVSWSVVWLLRVGSRSRSEPEAE